MSIHNLKVGDKVTMLSYGVVPTDVVYTVLEVEERFFKAKHPEIGGYFHFSKDRIDRVLPAEPEKK